MLKDEVWAEIGGKDLLKCLECAESDLGRKIGEADLLDCPANYFTFMVYGGKR